MLTLFPPIKSHSTVSSNSVEDKLIVYFLIISSSFFLANQSSSISSNNIVCKLLKECFSSFMFANQTLSMTNR